MTNIYFDAVYITLMDLSIAKKVIYYKCGCKIVKFKDKISFGFYFDRICEHHLLVKDLQELVLSLEAESKTENPE